MASQQQRILVTGASGNLGQDLIPRLSLYEAHDVVGTTSATLNLAGSPDEIRQALDAIRPQVIINSAAFTQVDAAETRFDEAMQVNAHGPRVMAEWAKANQVFFVHISTDYVFDGQKGDLYLPDDSTHPINRYGESKLAGERAVLGTYPEGTAVIRTSWLFGKGHKNFVPFLVQAVRDKIPVKAMMDQFGTPTWTGTLCKDILTVMADRRTGTFHGCSAGVTSRYEQAVFVFQQLGAPIDQITPITTAELNLPAPRPHNTAMQPSFEDAPHWEAAAMKFLTTEGLLNSHV